MVIGRIQNIVDVLQKYAWLKNLFVNLFYVQGKNHNRCSGFKATK